MAAAAHWYGGVVSYRLYTDRSPRLRAELSRAAGPYTATGSGVVGGTELSYCTCSDSPPSQQERNGANRSVRLCSELYVVSLGDAWYFSVYSLSK